MRLIDADALHRSIDTETYRHTYIEQIHGVVDNAPTIDKEILRKCKDKNRLCVHANVWNTCTDKPCEEGEKMTNREWLETLSDAMLASELSTRCGLCANQDVVDCGDCASNITTWLTQEYEPPKKELSEIDIVNAFQNKFRDRRAISLDEIKDVVRGLFE